jgi:hypothetical protein
MGHHQDPAQSSCERKLFLSKYSNGRITDLWNISNHHMQKGTGFFKDGILVVHFI